MAIINIQGEKYGRLLVIDYTRKSTTGNAMWMCRCECGNSKEVASGHLRSGHTTSCGCRQKERAGEANTTHGLRKDPLYETWASIKRRCYNKNVNSYNDYGGRGIKMCNDWKNNFVAFFTWAKSSNYKKGLSIERIDVNGNYCPENCTWIPRCEQSKNTRKSVVYNGETARQASFRLGGSECLVTARIKLGWSKEEAFTRKHNHVKKQI